MKKSSIKSDLLLLLAAAIWGFAFVAQRVGMNYVGAFTYNGVRFAIGSLSLVPLIFYFKDKTPDNNKDLVKKISVVKAGIIAGIVLFLAVSLQQVGLIGTEAGKAAFITGLYIVLVPIFGIALKHKIGINSWVGAFIAVIGLYFLCVTKEFKISNYDLLVLCCAVLFTIHILLIDYFIKYVPAIKLAFFQFLTCAILSMLVAIFTEKIEFYTLYQALLPILYGGIGSVGIAYTLQIVGQKDAEPTSAAIILSMEALFATLGGVLILSEKIGARGAMGSGLMFLGMIFSQLKLFGKKENII